MPSGRKPDYTLWAANDHGAGRCGVAWKNDDGSINVVLDTWAVVRGKGHTGAQTTIKLYPPDSLKQGKPQEENPTPPGAPAGAKKPAGKFDDLEDDIPF